MEEDLERQLARMLKKLEEKEIIYRAYKRNVERTKLELDLKAQLLDQEADNKENGQNPKLESQESVQNKLNNLKSSRKPTILQAAVGFQKQLSQKALKRNRSAQHVSKRNKSKGHPNRKKSAGASKKYTHLPTEVVGQSNSN